MMMEKSGVVMPLSSPADIPPTLLITEKGTRVGATFVEQFLDNLDGAVVVHANGMTVAFVKRADGTLGMAPLRPPLFSEAKIERPKILTADGKPL